MRRDSGLKTNILGNLNSLKWSREHGPAFVSTIVNSAPAVSHLLPSCLRSGSPWADTKMSICLHVTDLGRIRWESRKRWEAGLLWKQEHSAALGKGRHSPAQPEEAGSSGAKIATLCLPFPSKESGLSHFCTIRHGLQAAPGDRNSKTPPALWAPVDEVVQWKSLKDTTSTAVRGKAGKEARRAGQRDPRRSGATTPFQPPAPLENYHSKASVAVPDSTSSVCRASLLFLGLYGVTEATLSYREG